MERNSLMTISNERSGFGVALLVGALVSVTPIIPPTVQAQSRATAEPPPTFEVASIKPNKSGDAKAIAGCNGVDAGNKVAPVGRCIARNAPLKLLLALAYNVPSGQINQLISGG